MRIPIVVASLALVLVAGHRPAHACDPAEFLTPFDLRDRADVVVVADVTSVPRSGHGKVGFRVVETLKGTAAATLSVHAMGSTCDPGLAKGDRGILFLDASGNLVGLYDAFLTEGASTWTDALRRYGAAATDADRAAPLVDLAVSKDWTRSYLAAIALADRVELVLALDQDARDRIVARLAKVAKDHPLFLAAARLHDARVSAVIKRRHMGKREELAPARAVIASVDEGIDDPGQLADVISAAGTTAKERIAAFERCERVQGGTLDRYSVYLHDDDDDAAWSARADACRTGTPRG